MYFLYFIFWQQSQITHYFILNKVLHFGIIWGNFISRENITFSRAHFKHTLNDDTEEEKKDFAPAEPLGRDGELPSQLDYIPTSIKLHPHLLLSHQGLSQCKTQKFSTQDTEGTEVMDGLDEPWIYFPLEGRSTCSCSKFLSLQNILLLSKALGGLEAPSIKARQSYNIPALVRIDGEEQLLSLLM